MTTDPYLAVRRLYSMYQEDLDRLAYVVKWSGLGDASKTIRHLIREKYNEIKEKRKNDRPK